MLLLLICEIAMILNNSVFFVVKECYGHNITLDIFDKILLELFNTVFKFFGRNYYIYSCL